MLIEKTRRLKTKVKRTVVEGRFKINTRKLQMEVVGIACTKELKTPLTPKGNVKIDSDWLQENAPSDNVAVQTYLKYSKLQKILRTYLDLYSQTSQVYPRITTLGPRSGRRSYSGPNIQNIPKRKWGIRSLFVPRPGHYFLRCDYTAQELFTLAQAMIDLGIGKGPLWDCITSDKDPHILGATKTLDKSYDSITKVERDGQKVVAFGVPGGLGPKSLQDYAFKTFGVKWSLEEARAARTRFLDAFWDVDEFLKHLKTPQGDALFEVSGATYAKWRDVLGDECGWNVIGHLCQHEDPVWRGIGEKASRLKAGTLRTGRVRSRARFTEIANTHFQGLAADVTKTAEWEVFKEFGRPPALVVHDEIVMELPIPITAGPNPYGKKYMPYSVDEAQVILSDCMKRAFVKVCPDVGPYAKCECDPPLRRWGRATDSKGDEV